MDNIVIDANDLGSIMGLIWGHVPTKALEFAITTDLFEKIDQKISATENELAESIGWSVDTLQPMLGILTCFDLLQLSSSKYKLTEGCKKWFLKSSEQYLGGFVIRSSKLQLAYSDFLKFSKKGKPVPSMLNETMAAFGGDAEATKDFIQSMHGMSKEFSDELINSINIDNCKKILDVGCGKGTLAVSLIEKDRSLQCDMFDLSGVTEFTKKYVKQKGFESNCKIFESDWNEWKWVTNKYDCILLSQVLHEMQENVATSILRNAILSLKNGGLLVIVNTAPVDFVESPVSSIFSLNMVVELGTKNPTIEWIRQAVDKEALLELKLIPLPGFRVAWIGKKRECGTPLRCDS